MRLPPPGIKLKNTPPEYRLMLRLVSLAERRCTEANLETIANEIQLPIQMTLMVANALAQAKDIVVTDFSPPVITFSVPKEIRAKLVKPASTYQSYLEANTKRLAEGGTKKGAAWPPIDPELRAKCLEHGSVCAEQLLAWEHEHLAWQMAGCIARIGQEAVDKLVEQILAERDQIPVHEGLFKRFFKRYTEHRDQTNQKNSEHEGK